MSTENAVKPEWDPANELYPPEFERRYREAGYWTDDTFAQLLDVAASQYGSNEAVVGLNWAGSEIRWTYKEVLDRAIDIGAQLSRAGVTVRSRVLVQLPNIADFVPVVAAIFRIGAIPLFSIPAHRRDALGSFIEAAEPVAIVTVGRYGDCDHRKLMRETLLETEYQPQVLVLAEDPLEFEVLDSPTDSVSVPRHTHTVPAAAPEPTELAFLQVSGGTTGVPKLIPRSHAAYHYTLRRSVEICNVTQATRFLVVIPCAHNFAMSSPGILSVLLAGGTVVMCPDPMPSTAFELVEREKITLVSLVPPLLMLWLAMSGKSAADLSSLEVINVGGAALAAEAAARVGPTFGCTLQQVFGMAEGLVNYTRLDDRSDVIINSQGYPLSPADEIKILNEDGTPTTEGEPGVLWTRGPYTIRGYLGGVGADSFDEEGFYCPGDIVRRLPSGHLRVEGRISDHINRAGEKISAEEIENHIVALPQVVDAAVVGVTDPRLGERSCAFIVAQPGKVISHSEINGYLRDRGLANYKIPDQTIVREHFPVTGVGKLSRRALRKELASIAEDQELGLRT